jgi:hypothetical protein
MIPDPLFAAFAPPLPFISTQGNNLTESTRPVPVAAPADPRTVVLPVRDRTAVREDRGEERDRHLKGGGVDAMGDLFDAGGRGLEDATVPLTARDRAELLAASAALRICGTVLAIEDAECGAWITFPRHCHVRGCPNCEDLRARELVRRLGAAVDQVAGGVDRCSFLVVTALNPRHGELKRAHRRHQAHVARLRRSAPFVGAAAGVCPWPGHQGDVVHVGVGGGFAADECPVSQTTPGTWNLHTNVVIAGTAADPRAAAPFIPVEELRWWWRRITCPHHRSRCPGLQPSAGARPPRCDRCPTSAWTFRDREGRVVLEEHGGCAGGAWEVHISKLRDVAEAVKYVTKAGELLDVAPGALIEWWLAMRRAKMVRPFGSLYGIRFVEDELAQKRADDAAGLELIYVTEQRTALAPRVCPAHGGLARWVQALPLVVSQVDRALAMLGGFLMWRPPPT